MKRSITAKLMVFAMTLSFVAAANIFSTEAAEVSISGENQLRSEVSKPGMWLRSYMPVLSVLMCLLSKIAA